MNILKGFMIFGAICYMFLTFVESKNEKYFERDLIGMFACSFIALFINLVC